MNTQSAIAHARSNHERFVEQLVEALRIPSISTLPENTPDMFHMADFLAQRMSGLGLENVAVMPTDHSPMVYADWLHQPGKPTALIYGHYDVQPTDPIVEWETPPFDPSLRGKYIFARGASDMKGQIMAQLMALEALLAQGDCPVNVKYLLEGDEEVGSPALRDFIDTHRELLACDVVLNCDAMIHAEDTPSIVYALRGLAYFELEVTGPERDLHSGVFGGSIRNPIHVLCELIAGMHDARGQITLPGFYDEVRPLDDEEREMLRQVPYSDAAWSQLSGRAALFGEAGYSTIERVGMRPSLDVNGIWGGFQGEGAKTVLPARAGAKLSLRLVADQHHEMVEARLRAYLEEKMPAGCGWTLKTHSSGPGAVMDRHSPCMQAAVDALTTVFDKKPFFRREGASVPVVGLIQELLSVDSIMLGFGLPDDGIHGPNEHQSLPLLFKGIECYIHFLARLGEVPHVPA